MKKKNVHSIIKAVAIFAAAFLILATVILPVIGVAEAGDQALPEQTISNTPAAETDVMAAESPYSWTYLGTIAGATAATLLIVQFLKVPLDKVWKVPTRGLVYIIALVIMILAKVFTGAMTPGDYVLTAINAFLVSLSAYGSYELTFARFDKK